MQIVKVMGGLGNQMFAYSFALALRHLGREVALDTSWHGRHRVHNGWELGRLFRLDIPECGPADLRGLADLDEDLLSRIRRKLLGPLPGHVVERGCGYDPAFLGIEGDAYFDGYWQSPRYHEGIEEEISRAFAFPGPLEPEADRLLGQARGRTIIGVHVRRGDYLDSEAFGGVCDEVYYRTAITLLAEGVSDPLVAFFSDDLDWCRDRLDQGFDTAYVDWNRNGDSWRDMRLMVRCDRLAISNSSFSWWAARLGGPGRTIVAPPRWYGGHHPDNIDIVPAGWIRPGRNGTR